MLWYQPRRASSASFRWLGSVALRAAAFIKTIIGCRFAGLAGPCQYYNRIRNYFSKAVIELRPEGYLVYVTEISLYGVSGHGERGIRTNRRLHGD